MRQHQIVITLNADQYREVQRLAKMAGTTSIGHFLHTRLLTFLGLKTSSRRLDTTYDTENSLDLTQLRETITRMHKELKELLEHGEVSGYITGTAPSQDMRDLLVSFQFETVMQNDFATPSQPIYLSADTVFSELGVSLSQVSEETKAVDHVAEEKSAEKIPEIVSTIEPEEKKESPSVASAETVQPKIDFRTAPSTIEEAVQAAKSIEDELERLADQTFSGTPVLGNIVETKIEPLKHGDPLIDILDEGLVKIIEEKAATKITAEIVKPDLAEISALAEEEAQDEESAQDEDQPQKEIGGTGPPPKKRKK